MYVFLNKTIKIVTKHKFSQNNPSIFLIDKNIFVKLLHTATDGKKFCKNAMWTSELIG